MFDREKVISGLHDIGGFIAERIGIEQARNFLRTIDDVIELLKEQEEEIENLKQTAQSMMEGIVISTPMFHPCESCQEFNCDFCKFKRTHS